MRRTEQREHIFRMVFGIDFQEREEMPQQFTFYFSQLEDANSRDLDYMQQKAKEISEKADEIDSLINSHTTGWKTIRMNKVDLTILRLAVYEIMWDADVPTGVAIDEAVELAKKYSSEDGPSFVNGVLAKFAD